jgi:hypothetical protein
MSKTGTFYKLRPKNVKNRSRVIEAREEKLEVLSKYFQNHVKT